ncbi:hypothetical protein [Chryseobacterium paridis]|uniref:Outer membrane protein beta-barrel domain-containing protein n=1 Tax=Chryseobacterium paridis TaxID=2800328 RepID=A0ABS1FTC7_9FLAO|nr:hypothetical protein [Chryseobacterium paridis]MBK1895664.1 hypothetical protein [Chryseobacterium paridis]
MKGFFYACGLLISGFCLAQESTPKVKAAFFDGVAVVGYVDHGAFINFTGPNINLTYHNTKFILGMLPSLRIKEDKSEGTRNSAIMPTLGAGLTFVYKKIALQVPVYYNTKTSTQNGNWRVGIGLGYSLK